MNAKISVFVIFVEVVITILLHNLYDCTFNKKVKVSFKIYDVTAWTAKILQHILSNISRRKKQPEMIWSVHRI